MDKKDQNVIFTFNKIYTITQYFASTPYCKDIFVRNAFHNIKRVFGAVQGAKWSLVIFFIGFMSIKKSFFMNIYP